MALLASSVLLTILCIAWLYPVFMILMNSLKTERAITTSHAFELPNPLDRDGIRAQSDRYVHLIVVGMSRMGVAMGVTAAHIAHYPNFVTQGIRTRITFIDPDAEREMNFLKGRYEPLFRLSHHTLRKFDAAGSETTSVHTPQEDFLDVEWEFVAGGIDRKSVV